MVSRELGRGGMGIVYEATDPQIGRHLAIKIINFQAFTSAEESAVLRERLFREARSAGALSHPGIVVIYDVGEDNQMAYIAMELVDGPSLHEILASGHRLDPAQALDILRQAAADGQVVGRVIRAKHAVADVGVSDHLAQLAQHADRVRQAQPALGYLLVHGRARREHEGEHADELGVDGRQGSARGAGVRQ